MQLEILIEAIKNVVSLKNENLPDSYNSKDLLADLLKIYIIYLENVENSEYTPINNEGSLLYDHIQESVKKNLVLMTSGEEKTTFGHVTMLPEDDICDLIIGLENALHIYENTNKSAFLDEFIYQVRHNIHPYLVNCIAYFSQLESIHK